MNCAVSFSAVLLLNFCSSLCLLFVAKLLHHAICPIIKRKCFKYFTKLYVTASFMKLSCSIGISKFRYELGCMGQQKNEKIQIFKQIDKLRFWVTLLITCLVICGAGFKNNIVLCQEKMLPLDECPKKAFGYFEGWDTEYSYR